MENIKRKAHEKIKIKAPLTEEGSNGKDNYSEEDEEVKPKAGVNDDEESSEIKRKL